MTRWRKLGLATAGLALAGGLGIALSSRWIVARTTERVYRRVEDVPPRYVAIVLGAKVWSTEPSPILEDRLLAGKALLDAGRVQRILVSGDHGRRRYDEVNAMRDWLVRHGVPRDRVFLDHAGFRTNDTMQRAARIFLVKDAVVVTQEFHLPRSLYLAAHAGIDAVGLVADRRRYLGERYNAARESLARTGALLEVFLRSTEPKFLGDVHPITGDAAATWDRSDEITP